MRKLIIILLSVASIVQLKAQKEIYISQYQHNRYAVNTAFGGSNEALTLFGTYRKQWAGINGSPQAQLLSAHSPLKNEQIALGVEFFNQSFGATSNTGFAASYTYRLRQENHKWLALSANIGASAIASSWNTVPVYDPTDPFFSTKENITSPIVGLAAAWYGQRLFVGLSTPNLIYTDTYETGESSFDMGKSEWVATAGYMFKLNNQFQIQPSSLIRLNTRYGTILDVSASLVWQDRAWVGLTYRNSDEVTAMVAVEPIPHFRIAYSIDFSTGDVSSYNNGSHEISIRYHFGHTIKTLSPKFF